jgi:hypothetical protein
MTARYNSQLLVASDEIVAPPIPRACTDRCFEMPTGIYVAMALCFLGFVSVLSFAFMGPALVIPYAVFVTFIAAFFVLPGLWAAMEPAESRTKALEWHVFREKGMATATGQTGAGEATILALLLPFLILMWAVAIVTITAFV